MDDAGFPPRIDLLRGVTTAMAQNIAEENSLGVDSESAYIDRNWISRFLDRNPSLVSKFSIRIDRQLDSM